MILWFSGTGNSAHVADSVARRSGDAMVSLNERMRRGDVSPLSSARPWVLVCPTYAWRIPRVVTDLLSRTQLQGSRDLYVVLTCGTSIGNAAGHARRWAGRLGLVLRGCTGVVMPENYLALFRTPDAATARGITRWAERKISRIAEAVAEGRDLPSDRVSFFGRVASALVNPAFYRLIVKDR